MNQSIMIVLSELESILFYNKENAGDLKPEVEELHEEAKQMLERWHFLTGERI